MAKKEPTAKTIFWTLCGINALLIVLHLVFHWLELTEQTTPIVEKLVRRFSLDAEASIPAWFTSSLLLTQTGLFAYVFFKSKAQRSYWLLLSLVFLYLSIDEAAEIHELLIDPVQAWFGIERGIFFFAWIIPVGLVILVLGAVMFKFLWNLESRFRNQLFFAAAVFLLGAMGVEMISGAYWESMNFTYDFNYRMLNALEEGLEILGISIAIPATLSFLKRNKPHL